MCICNCYGIYLYPAGYHLVHDSVILLIMRERLPRRLDVHYVSAFV
jgi:hypothetical protein